MRVITWDKDDVQLHLDELDLSVQATKLINTIDDMFEYDEILTSVAMTALKMKLMGEYHAILVVRMEEYLEDSEIYLLTLDEAIEGGAMDRITGLMLSEVLTSETFGA